MLIRFQVLPQLKNSLLRSNITIYINPAVWANRRRGWLSLLIPDDNDSIDELISNQDVSEKTALTAIATFDMTSCCWKEQTKSIFTVHD